MFRFTIRDVLWLTVVVAVALTLWLGWSREIAALREDGAARETKLRDQVLAERDLWKTKTTELMKAYNEARVESLTQKAMAKEIQQRYSDRNSEIIRLQDEVRRFKAKKSATLFDP
jgi:hypothetical protein